MNETKKIKFPVAAIFCTANVLLGLISIFMTYVYHSGSGAPHDLLAGLVADASL